MHMRTLHLIYVQLNETSLPFICRVCTLPERALVYSVVVQGDAVPSTMRWALESVGVPMP